MVLERKVLVDGVAVGLSARLRAASTCPSQAGYQRLLLEWSGHTYIGSRLASLSRLMPGRSSSSGSLSFPLPHSLRFSRPFPLPLFRSFRFPLPFSLLLPFSLHVALALLLLLLL